MELFSFFKKQQTDTSIPESEILQDEKNCLIESEQTNKESSEVIIGNIQETIIYEELEKYDQTKDLEHFCLPPSDLLKLYEITPINTEQIEINKKKIIDILESNKIGVLSIKATIGYVNTIYEFVPKIGARLSKIKHLDEDLAFALLVPKLFIEAMFEKGSVAIIIPNIDFQILPLHPIITSKSFIESDFELPLIIGRTMNTDNFIIDLAKTPHILIAGATGQGKSVLLNVMITSLLSKKHPAELKFILIDTHVLEFNPYSFIEKYYLAKLPDSQEAIVSDISIAAKTFYSICLEMDNRYELLQSANTKNVQEYNTKFKELRLNPLKGHRYLPYLVVVIDEYYGLIKGAGIEIELPLIRLTQKAHIVGIHIILSTQRPTKDIITKDLKSSFLVRIAFSVASSSESKIIIDRSGAENLLGQGDALYCEGVNTTRLQVPYISTDEIESIVKYIASQASYTSAFELPECIDTSTDYIDSVELSDQDLLFEEAARLIVVHQQGSTSLIQRKFSIGYNRAGRIMDQLEGAGIVGVSQGSAPRDVLVLDEYSLEQKLKNL